jgi:chromosome segregation ATPase
VYTSEFFFRTMIPKRTVDEVRALSSVEFLKYYDEEHDAHAVMMEMMRHRYKDVLAEIQVLKDASSDVEDLKTKVREAEVALVVQEENAAAEIARLKEEIQAEKAKTELLKAEASADKATIDALRQDRVRLLSEYVPHVCKSLLASPDVLQSIGEAITANREEERSRVLEEFQADGQVDLTTRADYKPEASQKVISSAQEWETAAFPCIEAFSVNPDASVDDLLKIKP